MKKSERQSQVVLMCGISGSGKTHHARQLEEKGYKYISVDAPIWEKAGNGLFDLHKEEQIKLFRECREEMCRQFKDLLKRGDKIVVDATHCKRSIRDEMRKICADSGVTPVFAYCHADKEELWSRLSKRKGRGADDLIVTREELADYLIGFEPPQEDEKDFIILD